MIPMRTKCTNLQSVPPSLKSRKRIIRRITRLSPRLGVIVLLEIFNYSNISSKDSSMRRHRVRCRGATRPDIYPACSIGIHLE